MTESTGLVTYRVEPAQPGADGLVAYLTLNDPDRRNALSDALLDQLGDLLRRAAFDTEVRVIVLMSSHPRVFSSGGNLDAFADDREVRRAGAFSHPVSHPHRDRQTGRLRGQRRRAGRCAGHRNGV